MSRSKRRKSTKRIIVMKPPAEVTISALITALSLAAIQTRRIIKGELPMWGGLKQWNELKVDSFDKVMLVIAGVSFSMFAYLSIFH
jgi:hypothetical protein